MQSPRSQIKKETSVIIFTILVRSSSFTPEVKFVYISFASLDTRELKKIVANEEDVKQTNKQTKRISSTSYHDVLDIKYFKTMFTQ